MIDALRCRPDLDGNGHYLRHGIGEAITSTESLDALAVRVNAKHEAAQRLIRAGCLHAIAAGDGLLEAKARLSRGQWLPWLQTHCPDITLRLAQKYMQVARARPWLEANAPRVAHLSFRAALATLTRAAVVQRGVRGSLVTRFVVPPFSVLDARQAYWQEAKRWWRERGLREEEGRAENLWSQRDGAITKDGRPTGLDSDYLLEKYGKTLPSATSLFDPVLAEIVYRWFAPAGGSVLDPTAGEASKGIVAGVLGMKYHGIEIRPEQVAANQKQANDIGVADSVQYILGDATVLGSLLPPEERYDLVFTCPPYYDLERYSEADASALPSYPVFMAWYGWVFAQAVDRLRENRFLCVVVGDVRDKATGAYRNFLRDNLDLFDRLGLHLYNDAVLLTPVGSMAVRAGRQFGRGRKLVKGHQNVLVFYKGDPRCIREEFPDLNAADGPTRDDESPGDE